MKIKFLFIVLISLISTTSIFASFPVQRTVTETTTSTNEVKKVTTTTAVAAGYNTTTAALLAVFLGWPFAAHRWYAKKNAGINILFIITFAGIGIWWWVDFIRILTGDF